jgi:hypothetical protein
MPEQQRKFVMLNQSKLTRKYFAQLSSFVSSIAALYQDNPFHNFEHASHVTMSVVKLLPHRAPSDNIVTRG